MFIVFMVVDVLTKTKTKKSETVLNRNIKLITTLSFLSGLTEGMGVQREGGGKGTFKNDIMFT